MYRNSIEKYLRALDCYRFVSVQITCFSSQETSGRKNPYVLFIGFYLFYDSIVFPQIESTDSAVVRSRAVAAALPPILPRLQRRQHQRQSADNAPQILRVQEFKVPRPGP